MKVKETPVQNMAFIGMMTAVNIVFCTIARFFPFSSLLLMIFLPIISCVVTIVCKWQYVIIYGLASFVLCLVIDPDTALFYVLSSLASGIIFAVCIKKNINIAWALLMGTLTTSVISYATLPLIKGLFGVSVQDSFQKLLNISANTANMLFPLYIVISSVLQICFSYLIMFNEIKKFHSIPQTKTPYTAFAICAIIISLITIGVIYLSKPIGFFLIGIAYIFGSLSFINIAKHNKYWLYLFIVLATLFIFAIFFTLMKEPYSYSLFVVLPLISSIISLILSIIKPKDLFDKVPSNGYNNDK